MSDPDEHGYRNGTHANRQRGQLARDLERLIQELDDNLETTEPAPISDIPRTGEPARPRSPADSPDPDVAEEVARLRADVQDLTETLLSVRADLLNAIVRTEQQMRDEIALTEKRFRGDLSGIRDHLTAVDSRLHRARYPLDQKNTRDQS